MTSSPVKARCCAFFLYGGSVKPGNAAKLLLVKDVDGALVGGASLIATEFMGIAGDLP